jgi:hypothetical protein
MVGSGATSLFNRRSNEAARNHKTWERASAQAVHPRRPLGMSARQSGKALLGSWITELKNRKPSNIATIALANKLARIAWSVLNRNEVYRGGLGDLTAVG